MKSLLFCRRILRGMGAGPERWLAEGAAIWGRRLPRRPQPTSPAQGNPAPRAKKPAAGHNKQKTAGSRSGRFSVEVPVVDAGTWWRRRRIGGHHSWGLKKENFSGVLEDGQPQTITSLWGRRMRRLRIVGADGIQARGFYGWFG